MNEIIPSPLEAWASFYVIVGSSAGALTGLQFVVMSLIAGTTRGTGGGDTVSAFGTPNVVHFCAALLVSAIVAVPWGGLAPPGIAIALSGAAGVVYAIVVTRRAVRQRDYEPVFEDWLWHSILPGLCYATLVASGIVLAWVAPGALYGVGAAALLLVFVGIHNAWDTVTFVTMRESAAAAARAPAPVVRAPAPPPPPAGEPGAS